MKTALTVLLCGLTAGVVNGVLGTGGGILIVGLLSKLYADSDEYGTKDIFSMTILCVFLMSLSAFFRYTSAGFVSFSDVKNYLLPAVLGGLLGAFLLDRLKASVIKRIFALLVIYAGLNLLLR